MKAGRAALAGQRRPLMYNAASLACLAAAGLATNLLIARVYGPANTGLFNQVLAFYLVAGQFAAFGLHLAALRTASLLPRGAAPDAVARLISNFLAVTSATAIATMAAGGLFALMVPRLFMTEGLARAWLLAVPGLYFFALNKVLINIANGLERHTVFAAAQSGRPVLLLAICCFWIYENWSGQTIALSLTLSEASLTMALLAYFIRADGAAAPSGLAREGERMLGFGLRVLPGSALADLNTRIDIIVLGLFVPAAATGVYTLAAWIAEGALQLPAAVRPLLSARLAQLSSSRDDAALRALVRQVGAATMAATASILTAICLCFPLAVEPVLADPLYREALWPLVILSTGVVVASYYLPFDFLLSQSGRPLAQSAVRGTMIGVNILLSLALVPPLGVVGAAAAYSLSFLAYATSFRIASGRLIANRASAT
jgi:O-antigen/teichoic acid export membrane protein